MSIERPDGAPLERPATAQVFSTSRVAMSFSNQISVEQWAQIGPLILRHADLSNWWLGDWVAFGQRNCGSRYQEAIAATGLGYKTLRNYAVVTRRFEVSRRRDTLSFGHHAEVCALDDDQQEHWLDLAQQHRWSRAELRQQLRGDQERGPTPRLPALRLPLDTARVELWRRAASASGRDFQAWVIAAVDAAAIAATTVDSNPV